ncbi:hypothetical protein Y032_0187g1120 [Ancylostoma ceylanicum]|uniref:Uncharacterized protein n=1 Tax=Ancylostoma ceylanicum TaxID=53326 RepID=A0A016SRK4_9BILA|nr:hypothetical protein Y032_0187g1120 [Ancylostoma ceylanicum]
MLRALLGEENYDLMRGCGEATDNTLHLALPDLMERKPFAKSLGMQTTDVQFTKRFTVIQRLDDSFRGLH